MTYAEPLISKNVFLEIAHDKGLSNIEADTLWQMLNIGSSAATADAMGTRPEVIRNRLQVVYRKFSILGAGPGKLAKLQQQLATMARAYPQAISPAPIIQPLAYPPRADNLPSAPTLIGRDTETLTLRQFQQQNVQIIALLGPPGIGKTALAVAWAQPIASQFEQIIWIALDPAPQIINAWSSVVELTDDRNLPHQILQHLKQHKCLLILDRYDALLQPQQNVGTYSPEHTDYSTLLTLLGTQPHRSTCLITSAEKPTEILQLESTNGPVRSIPLTPLEGKSANTFWKTQGLTEDPASWSKLTQHYQGNPGLMQLAANTIKELFNGQASALLNANIPIFDQIDHLLSKSWQRLTPLEQEITYLLALDPTPATHENLEDRFAFPPSTSELFQALSFLRRRYLLETDASEATPRFYLAAITQQYVTQQLAHQLTLELLSCLALPESPQLDPTKVIWLSRLPLDRLPPTSTLSALIQRQVRRQAGLSFNLSESLSKFAETLQGYGFQTHSYLSNNCKWLHQLFSKPT